MTYKLTNHGKEIATKYIHELEAKRKEILDARLDTIDDIALVTLEDIECDVNFEGLDEDGEYYNGWAVTDNYDADYPLLLKFGRDIYEEDD